MKQKLLPVIIVIVLILLLGVGYAGKIVYDKYSYSDERADLTRYFGIQGEGDVPVILGNEFADFHAKLIDGIYYLDFATVQSVLNDRFYYGPEDGTLIYTTPTQILTSPIGATSVSISDGTTEELAYAPARLDGDTLYVALDYVQKYTDFTYTAYTEPAHIQMDNSLGERTTAEITKNTKLRHSGGVKSEILEDLSKGDTVVILEQMESWSKVKSSDSYIGYVENKFLKNIQTSSQLALSGYTEPEYTSVRLDGKVNLAWQSIGGTAGNSILADSIANTRGLNVISPTWLSLSDNEGGISSFATTDYVERAHANGLQVWAALDNFNNSFYINGEGHTEEVLRYASHRSELISNLMDEVSAKGIDGINVDFEFTGSDLQAVQEDGGEDYIEFIRELSIACRQAGVVLSVDVPVPFGNGFFHRKELGTVCDYVIIMGYDEHYDGSQEAGSVASIGYVEKGIKDTLEVVPADKLVNGIPFYTRIWFTASDQSVSSQAGGMAWARDYITSNGIELNWDQTTCQYYGEMLKSDGTKVQIWMEDIESIQAKLGVMQANGIAGVAEWQLGYETDDVWEAIAAYVGS